MEKKQDKQQQSKQDKEGKKPSRVAVLRVRGKVHVRQDIEDTLKHLNLKNINHCTVVEDSKHYVGMINKVNDYVTWGEIDAETFNLLLRKRGQLPGHLTLDDAYMKENTRYSSIDEFVKAYMDFKAELSDIPGLKRFFRLNPPVKGYDRGGVKRNYKSGGVLGYRGKEINKLLKRMI